MDDVIIKNFFPLFFKMAESFENLENILPDWANEDVKSLLSYLSKCGKDPLSSHFERF